jgi:hypothetical protein
MHVNIVFIDILGSSTFPFLSLSKLITELVFVSNRSHEATQSCYACTDVSTQVKSIHIKLFTWSVWVSCSSILLVMPALVRVVIMDLAGVRV